MINRSKVYKPDILVSCDCRYASLQPANVATQNLKRTWVNMPPLDKKQTQELPEYDAFYIGGGSGGLAAAVGSVFGITHMSLPLIPLRSEEPVATAPMSDW